MDSAGSGHVAAVQWLVEQGVDILARDDQGRNAVHIAAVAGHLEVVKWFRKHMGNSHSRDASGSTVIFWAVLGGHLDVIQWLWRNGSDLAEKDDQGRTLLMGAVAAGHIHVVKWLVGKPEISLTHQDVDGNTALTYASNDPSLSDLIELVAPKKPTSMAEDDKRSSTKQHASEDL